MVVYYYLCALWSPLSNPQQQRDGERLRDKVRERYWVQHDYELEEQRSSKSFYGSLRRLGGRRKDKVAAATEAETEHLRRRPEMVAVVEVGALLECLLSVVSGLSAW